VAANNFSTRRLDPVRKTFFLLVAAARSVYPAVHERSAKSFDKLFTAVEITPLTSVLASVQSATRLIDE